ncbi:hypothetical protein DOTSEDRAFT_75196 [Dothistroma septosporum NZE10]|uniref:Uncharacterized protein n=1 Tax=Dothistroma septosporum (strain NZE10 / CBS 128990) TaxID=675120 RepID=M2XJ01_DOTSN|nr:hypothetical protein DOTSEDRAFT_75196 [Dothistroma septosporum NZE10]
MARKIVCLRPTESSDRVVQHLTKTCLHRHAMAKGVSRKTARSRQESSKSALNLLSVASALSDIVVPDFKAVRSDALDKKTEPGESHRVPSVSKPAPEQLFDDSRSTRPNTLTRLDSSSTSCHGKPTQSRGVLQGKLSSRRQELAPSDKDRTISNRDTGSRRQHQPVDMKSRSSSSDDAPYPSGNHSGGSPQYEARSSGSLQASKLQLSGLHVLFELTPSDFHGHDAKSIGKAGTRPVASVEQQKNEVAQIATLESFSPCIGAEQEVVPVAQTRSDRGRSSEEETLQDELSHRQQSSLDAMQKFVRKERRLLAKALLQLPSSGKLDVKDVPDNVGEAMKLLLKDSRSFLQWTLKAKREQLEREDTAAKARDKSSETEVKSDCAAESEISIPGIRCAAMMVNDIARVVRVALMLIVAIGIILSSV